MTQAWIEGAHVIEAVANGGTMVGKDHYVTWHSTENDPYTTTAANIAHYLNQTRNCVHVLWNPVSGEIVVTMPSDVAGRGLENPSGGVETNRNGKINVQVEVVARAVKPFTDYPMVNREKLLAAFDALGVPRQFPCGQPLPYPKSYGANGQRHASALGSGHVTHSQWEENVHGDPGAIDIIALLSGVPAKPIKPTHQDVPPTLQFHRENGDGKYERGEEGPGIKTLQRALHQEGYHPGARDGFFGNQTLQAVKAFQRDHHLDDSGVADAKVLHRLGISNNHPNGPSLKVDGHLDGATWKAIQHACGLRDGEIDGIPGPQTIRALQHHVGVKVDGILGPNTKRAVQRKVHVNADGIWGPQTIMAWQRALNTRSF